MNFARDVVGCAPPDARALVELGAGDARCEWTFGEVATASGRIAAALAAEGVARGDTVLIWLGPRSEWILSMLACMHLGAIPVSCPEQLRAADLRQRMDAVTPRCVVADERNRGELERAQPEAPVLWLPDPDLGAGRSIPAHAELSPTDPCLMTFTSGTSGAPKAVVHLQSYLSGQQLQARHWLAPQRNGLTWCTAPPGWSKSARNVFVAPWLRGSATLVHDERFDPGQRLEVIDREGVDTLCMAPTEYRILAKRTTIGPLPALRRCCAAGEALDPGVLEAWREATGLTVRDGYGQTETGQMTGFAPGEEVRPGSMGRPLPGVALTLDGGELIADPSTVPTFFHAYLGEHPVDPSRPWRTGDRAEADEDGYLWFRGRADDLIVSSGYRIGPVEVEAALGSHPAVEEAAAVAAPDEERGSIVRGVVVLARGFEPGPQLARELQDHVKALTAPYKYPRRIDFVDALPKTPSGKVRRAQLRREPPT